MDFGFIIRMEIKPTTQEFKNPLRKELSDYLQTDPTIEERKERRGANRKIKNPTTTQPRFLPIFLSYANMFCGRISF